MLNELLLLSGNDIPFPEAQIIIHQPKIKEIAYMGEENFYTACEFLKFSKDKLNEQDRIHLENCSNFEVIMSIMKEQNAVVQKHKVCVTMLLSLLFPEYTISLKEKCIVLKLNEEEFFINDKNFESFKKVLNKIFCLSGGKDNSTDYNPSGEMARQIAEKLNSRHQKLAEMKSEGFKSILGRYVSILAVGEKKDMNELLQYTVYQLFDEFKRYELKVQYDIYFKARLAGAKDLKEVDDWMKDIHS